MPKRSASPRDEILPPGLVAGGLAFEVVSAAAGGEFTPPEWIQLTPRGRVTARDGRIFVFDPERLAAAFAAGGLHLPVDFDHETEKAARGKGTDSGSLYKMDCEMRPARAIRPVAGYVGGKKQLSKMLAERIAGIGHTTYAEAFVGMGGCSSSAGRRRRPR